MSQVGSEHAFHQWVIFCLGTPHSGGQGNLYAQMFIWIEAYATESLEARSAERHQFTGCKTCPFFTVHLIGSPLAAVPMQQGLPPPVMHSREADVSISPLYSLANESPIDPRVVIELEVRIYGLYCMLVYS